MTALAALEMEARRRGVTRVNIVISFEEAAERRYRVFPINGHGFSIQWHYGPTPEAAMQKLVQSLPARDVVVESDAFPITGTYRRTG